MKLAATGLFVLFLAYVVSRMVAHTLHLPWLGVLPSIAVLAAWLAVRLAK